MTVSNDPDLVASIAGMLGMSSQMEGHFLKLINAVEEDDVQWQAAVKIFQRVEPTFTDEQADLVRTVWMAQK